MSFKDLKKDELLAVSDYFGVDVKKTDNKDSIVAALAEDGVTFDQYEEYKAATETENDDVEGEPDPVAGVVTSAKVTGADEGQDPGAPVAEPEAKEESVRSGDRRKAAALVPDGYELVKKTRNNPVYEVRGYRFTDVHPYVLVKEDDVDFLVEVEGGFAVAKTSEVMDFYA